MLGNPIMLSKWTTSNRLAHVANIVDGPKMFSLWWKTNGVNELYSILWFITAKRSFLLI